MKKIETHIHKYGIRYKCEKCLNIFSRGSKALECEEIHACEHVYEYKLAYDNRDPQYCMPAIKKYCIKCGHKLESMELYFIDHDQKILKKIYRMIDDEIS